MRRGRGERSLGMEEGLRQAARRGDLETLKALIAQGAVKFVSKEDRMRRRFSHAVINIDER